MSHGSLEDRVARLEDVIDQIVSQHATDGAPRLKDWRRTTGTFKDDPIMREITDGALRMREEERRQISTEDDGESR